jgi:monothiol glutaredoxin
MPSFKNIFKVVGSEQAHAVPPSQAGDVMERIAEDVKSNRVLIYMKGTPEAPMCGFSAATIEVFNALGAAYETRNVLEDAELRQAIKEYSNWPTIPQVYVDGKFVGGCDIVTELHATGELAELLKA